MPSSIFRRVNSVPKDLSTSEQRILSTWILGVSLIIGLSALGFLLGKAMIDIKQLERSITVKGLSEHEYPADVVICPIQ